MTSGIKPPRTLWPAGVPDVVLHASESAVLRHEAYAGAKSGDADAAWKLRESFIDFVAVDRIAMFVGGSNALLVSVHAQEADGLNAILEAMANNLSGRLLLEVARGVIQINRVGHTKAKGDVRLARQAAFSGHVESGRCYLLVDDFIGQGGTLANLKGHIEANGGIVIGATALTGRPDSVVLAPNVDQLGVDQLGALRAKHGRDLEDWWRAEF
jgi:hypothetical protein